MDCSVPGSSVHGNSPDKNIGVSCHAFLQGIFTPCMILGELHLYKGRTTVPVSVNKMYKNTMWTLTQLWEGRWQSFSFRGKSLHISVKGHVGAPGSWSPVRLFSPSSYWYPSYIIFCLCCGCIGGKHHVCQPTNLFLRACSMWQV